MDLVFGTPAILVGCSPDARDCHSAIQPFYRDANPAACGAAHAPAFSHEQPLASVVTALLWVLALAA